MNRRDLLDRAQPQDVDKAPDLAAQEQAGFRPRAQRGREARHPEASASADASEPSSHAERRRLNPKRERATFRPRDEGGATPSPRTKSG